jgi:Putative phage metallopeptidase
MRFAKGQVSLELFTTLTIPQDASLQEMRIEEGAPLQNEDHFHLRFAHIGVLWTSIENSRAGRRIVGQAERGEPAVIGKWARARAELQIMQWFGTLPDFILTFDAGYAVRCSDAECCSLMEHELAHCGIERDMYGAPKFRKSAGLPAFTLVSHDVEEFVGVVRRYGMISPGIAEMVRVANEGPTIAPATIAHACGTCLK